MMQITTLLLLFNIFAAVIGSDALVPRIPTLSDLITIDDRMDYRTVNDVIQFIDDLKRNASLTLAKSFSKHIRKHRNAQDISSLLIEGSSDYHFDADATLAGYMKKSISHIMIPTRDKVYLVICSTRPDILTVVDFTNPEQNLNILSEFNGTFATGVDIDQIDGSLYGNQLWLAVGSSTSHLISIIRVDVNTGKTNLIQNINRSLGALHMFQFKGNLYLIIGTHQRGVSPLHGSNGLYMLLQDYFDIMDELPLNVGSITSIAGFPDGINYYFVTAGGQEGLLVYQFNPDMHILKLIQELPSEDGNVSEVKYFLDQHDDKIYLITLSINGSPNIYWWEREQLILWQELSRDISVQSSSVGVLMLGNLETLLFIAYKEQIIFYSDDQTAHYQPMYSLNTECLHVTKLQGFVKNGSILISYNCVEADGSSASYKAKTLITTKPQAQTERHQLAKCLEDLTSTLEARKENVAAADRLAPSLMVADRPQEWSGHIEFSKGLNVIGDVIFNSNVTLLDHDGVHREFLETASLLDEMEDAIENFTEATEHILLYSQDQNVSGSINTSKISTENSTLGVIKLQAVNGVSVHDIPNEFLIDTLDQTIDYSLHIAELKVDELDTQEAKLNDIYTKDFLRKDVPDQIVTGSLFFDTVAVGNVFNSKDPSAPVIINGIKTTDILLKDNNISLNDSLYLDTLNIQGQLDFDLINGKNLSNLSRNAVYTDSGVEQELHGHYVIDSLSVLGNMDVISINNVDLKELDGNVVKKTGDFQLEGPLVYNSDLTVEGNLDARTVNDIPWSDVVSYDSKGLILGQFNISNIFISEEIICNDINGIDLNPEAFLRSEEQVLNGHVVFSGKIIVSGEVFMSDGILVNGIDFSKLSEDLDNRKQVLHVKENANFSLPINVFGDVAVESINGIPMEGIEQRFWSRSLPQIIDVPVQVDEAIFSGDVVGDTINGHPITEFVNTHEAQNITGNFAFENDVSVDGNLIMRDGREIDGSDISEKVKDVITLSGNQTINGDVTFQKKVTVFGDMDVLGHLDRLNVPEDLVFLDRSQIISDETKFLGVVKASTMTLNGNLSVSTINGMDAKKMLTDIAIENKDEIINSPIVFTGDVYVDKLNADGNIDGINIKEIIEDAVKKSSEDVQHVTAPVTINGTLHFGKVSLSEVNDKEWSSHLNSVVDKDYDGTIRGVKEFTQPLNVSGEFRPEKIDGKSVLNITESLLTKSGSQTIHGNYMFNKTFIAGNINCTEIGGVNVSELLLIDDEEGFLSQVVFKENVTFSGGLQSNSDIMDGCNITELEELSPSVDEIGSYHLYSPMKMDQMHIRGNMTLNDDLLLGVNKVQLEPFLRSLVLKSSSDDEITGTVVFRNTIKVDVLEVDLINGVELKDFINDSVRDDEDITLKCDLEFRDKVKIKKLNSSHISATGDKENLLINGIDIWNLLTEAARLTADRTVIVSGSVNFTNQLTVNNLTVTERINNTKVSDFVRLSQSDRVADVIFNAPITVNKNLQVFGRIDGVNLSSILDNRITLSQDQTVEGNYTFENIVVDGDIEVASINGIKISDMVVKYGRSVQEILGHKEFNHLNINGDIEAPVMNGMDINDLQQSIIRKDQDFTFYKPMTFEDEVRIATLIPVDEVSAYVDLDKQMDDIHAMRNNFKQVDGTIKQLCSSTHLVHFENYAEIETMFSELAFLEEESDQYIGRFGTLSFIKDPIPSLSIRSCLGRNCTGNAITSFYSVFDDGGIDYSANEEISGSKFLMSDLSTEHLYEIRVSYNKSKYQEVSVISVYSQSEGNMNNLIAQEHWSSESVIDAHPFIDQLWNYYIVLVTRPDVDCRFDENSALTTLKFDNTTNRFATVWTKPTQNCASKLSFVIRNGTLLMLVINDPQSYDGTGPLSKGASLLYQWECVKQEFQLLGEFGGIVTSGLFMKALWPLEDVYFSLSQLKANERPPSEENHFKSKEVLIYRYSAREQTFKVFQLIKILDVVDQATFTIDKSLYLVLLSEARSTLYVFEYIPLEEFRLYQEVSIRGGMSVEVIELPGNGEKFVMVLTRSSHLIRLSVKTKGLDPDDIKIIG